MRFIGHKQKIISSIEGFLRDHGVALRGRFVDAFAGTGSVGAHFRRLGMEVVGCDLLHSSFAFQVALLESDRPPAFARVIDGLGRPGPGSPLARVLAHLGGLEPREGFVYRNFTPGGPAGRMYFTAEVGRSIDAALERIREWVRGGALDRQETQLLIASLIAAADRVANTTGVYAAFLKSWQANALRPLVLEPFAQFDGPVGEAHREDANRLVATTPCEILYIDPPYNHRQYAGNYHVPEVLAEFHAIDDLASYERALAGVTGMRPARHQQSRYCLRRESRGVPRCEAALRELIASAQAQWVLVSYNEEGLISREAIADDLAEYEGVARFDFDGRFRALSYQRYRSDEDGRGTREYRQLPGRGRNEVCEWLFLAKSRRAVPPAGTSANRRDAGRTLCGLLPPPSP